MMGEALWELLARFFMVGETEGGRGQWKQELVVVASSHPQGLGKQRENKK